MSKPAYLNLASGSAAQIRSIIGGVNGYLAQSSGLGQLALQTLCSKLGFAAIGTKQRPHVGT